MKHNITLSPEITEVLVDLIKTRIDIIQINDRADLRERITLQRALVALIGVDAVMEGVLGHAHNAPKTNHVNKAHDYIYTAMENARLSGQAG